LGAEGELLSDSVLYGRIILAAMPAFMLQQEFQSFFVTAERPKMGLFVTLAAGGTNMLLDFLFVAVFKWGLVGAALATAGSQVVGGVVPIVYFLRPNKSLLRLGRPNFDGRALVKTCTNGSSELFSNVAMSLVGLLYNAQLMRYVGSDGIAAYGVMMYVGWIFVSIFVGFSIGTAPLIGYNYGAQNKTELKNLFRKCLIVTGVLSLAMFILGETLARPLSMIFVSYNQRILDMTVRGFRIFSFQFIFCGLAIFGSGFFTALGNGLISAIISFTRTLIFQIGAVLLLPLVFDLDGIWASVIVAEAAAAILSVIFIIINKKKYGY
jgi:Na+-driven multidrug efflux pump